MNSSPKNWKIECSACKKELDVVEVVIENNLTTYKLACGHNFFVKDLQETIGIIEQLKGKLRHGEPGEFKPHLEFSNKIVQSGDPRLPRGVRITMRIDRENNQYHQVVTDLNTGKVIHQHHEPLTEHKSEN